MALSLDTIYTPLNDFFIEKFRTDASSPIFFRFDKLGSSVSEQDFSSPAQATETFSYLVNRIPREEPDGLHVCITPYPIDDLYYYQLLGKCLPYIPADGSDAAKESILSSFSKIKADALKLWESIRLVSVTGLMTDFRPSTAIPEDWYDKSSPNWTSHSLEITQTSVLAPADESKFQLWTLKASDAVMQKALDLNEPASVAPTNIYNHIREARVDPEAMNRRQGEARAMVRKTAFSRRFTGDIETVDGPDMRMSRGARRPFAAAAAFHQPATESTVADALLERTSVHDVYLRDRRALNLRKRMIVDDYLETVVPKQPVITNSIRVSFDFRIVDIRRDWYMHALIHDNSWFIPLAEKGQLTCKGQAGSTITAMPVGLVAIKNLSVEAAWAAEDIERSRTAINFGPFKVNSQIVDNKLTCEGIQIIGWLLEKMPELPPISDPTLATRPQSSLTFKAPTPSLITTNQPFDVILEGSPAIVKVDLIIDGKPLATIDSKTNNQFIFRWDISSLSEANHILEAIGYDSNSGESSRASVIWMNDTP